MRFMVMVPANEETEAGVPPDEKGFAEMSRFNEEMVKAGVLLAGEGLQPSSKGARIKFSDGKTSVARGPFPGSKGSIAGFWIIQAKSLEDAIDWMKRAPVGDGVELEIRQLFEADDFAASDPTGELRAAEKRMRAQVAEQQKKAAA